MSDIGIHAARPPVRLAFGSLLRADFAVLLRLNRTLIVSLALPIVILVIVGFGQAANRVGGAEYLTVLAITYGLLSSGLLGYSLSVARDRDAGVLQRLRITPAPTWTIMTSRLIVQAVANLAISIIVLIVGSILHHFVLTAAQYALVLVVSILGGAVFLALGQALVGLLKSSATINAVGRLLYILLILFGLLGPLGVLGDVLKAVSLWTPVGVVFGLFSAVLNLAAWTAQDTYLLLACFGYIVVFAAIGIRWFQWESR